MSIPMKEVTVTVKRLVAGPIGGIAKFENVTFEVSASADVQPSMNPNEVYDHLLGFCKRKINNELDRLEGIVPETSIEDDYIPEFKPVK